MKYFIRYDIKEALQTVISHKLKPCPICGSKVSITTELDAEGDEMAVVSCCIARVATYLHQEKIENQLALAENTVVKWWNDRKKS